MPITLPQLSRRDFLKRAALTGVALAVAPTSHAGWFGKSRDKNTLFLWSDTHIAADAAAQSRGVTMADNLASCVREMSAWKIKPAALIVNGDLALKDGQLGDYDTLAKGLLPLRAIAPIHLNLGNHDEREQFWSALPKDVSKLANVARQAAVFSSPNANWFLLDSLDKTNSTPGEFGEVQLAWLDEQLSHRKNQPAIVVAHHNLHVSGNITGLKDSPAFEALLVKHPQVKAFIFGHTHNWNITQHVSGVHLINLPPTAYIFKEGRPNGWVRCTVVADGAEFELRALDPKHPEHAQVQKLVWRV